MLKICFTFLFTCTFALVAFSQTPEPTVAPIEDVDDVVKISTNLIQIDVTVTDKKGNILRDLTAKDFEIYENGKKQKITGISFISSQSQPETNDVKETNEINIELPTPVKELRPSDVRRTFALVVDDLSLSFESTYQVKRALKNFVNEQMQDGDLVAIVRTGSGIGALQQFTSDKRRLYAAIDKIKWNLRGAGGVGAFRAFSVSDNGAELGAGTSEEGDVQISEENLDDFRRQNFASGSLGAIQYVVKGMDRLPGRKSVILFSDGFQIFSRGGSGLTGSSRVLDSLTNLVETANRASVVMYTVDARGLQTLGATAADDFGSKIPFDQPRGGIAQAQRTANSTLQQRRNDFATSQDGINYLAKETGGFAIYNTNDLKGSVKKILNDQSYYLIAYEPDEESFDPTKQKFNKLEVKVLKDNVDVRYRSGFFGISDDSFKKPTNNLTKDEKLLDALVSPFAINDINMSLSTIFKGDDKDNLFVDSYLHISPENIKFTETDKGTKRAVVDIYIANFGDNGIPTDQISKTFIINAREQIYETIMRDGFVYYFTLPIEKAGAYQMRAAIRDHATDKVGSASQFIEIPKLKKNRLTLSGIVVDNISYIKWNEIQRTGKNNSFIKTNKSEDNLTALADTALRRFKRGSVLTYAFEIYNSKTNSRNNPNLRIKTRLFRDNKMVYEGSERSIQFDQKVSSKVKEASGAINLADNLISGDYVLQIIITDKLAGKKRQIAMQFVQFEIVE